MTTTEPRPAHRAVYARMARNIAWLLGSKGFGGLASLVYLVLAARSLGAAGFGTFSTILAYAQLIANLMQFQSWQAVIRYGAPYVQRDERFHLGRLLGFTASVDLTSAIVGSALALGGISYAGAWLGWRPEQEGYAAMLGVALLFSIIATPSGMLRLVDRFDLMAYSVAVVPAVRLVGSVIVWLLGGGLAGFLLTWAAAALLQAVATWACALWVTRFRLYLGIANLRAAWRENAGIARFMIATNLTSSLSMLWDHLGTLSVGGTSGAAAAGGYRIASRLAKALSKPVSMMSKVLFPELTRLAVSEDRVTLRHVIGRVTLVAVSGSLLVVLVAWLGGGLLLKGIAGPDFAFAHGVLILLAVSAAVDLAGFALEPWLTAHGHAGKAFAARLTATLLYAGLMWLLLPSHGPEGAAIAAIVGSFALRLMMLFWVSRLWKGPSGS